MLISCPDCTHTMSDKAPNCPKCGCPNGTLAPAELTSKELKLQKLAAGIVALGSLPFVFTGLAKGYLPLAALAAVPLVSSLAWLVGIEILIWWRHK